MLTLPKYSQRDSQWFSKQLGNSGQSVGMQGCTITAAAMAAFAYGKGLSPGDLVQKMNNANGFDSTGSLNWLILAKVLGLDWGMRWDTTANVAPNHMQVNEPAALLHIERLAGWGMPTICWVDTDHDGKANHWVTYVGGGQCIDPWDGQQKDLSKVFVRLYGYAVLNGTGIMGDSVTNLIGKANEIANGRNVALNAAEIMQVVNRP